MSKRKCTLMKSVLGSQRSGFELEKALWEFSLCVVCLGIGGEGVLFYFLFRP